MTSDLDNTCPPSSGRPALRLYILASGRIAVPVVAALCRDNRFDVVGVGSQPDRPAGRKLTLLPTPVAAWCAEHGIEADKAADVNADDALASLESRQPNMLLLMAYGQILRKTVLKMPPCGCINIHASLLPRHRGASPIEAVILAGDDKTGITYCHMVPAMDAGPVYSRFETTLEQTERAPELEARLAQMAAETAGDNLVMIAEGTLTPKPQDPAQVTYARKLRKEDAEIDWSRPAIEIERQVRAYTQWPGAWFMMDTKKNRRKITLTRASVAAAEPGARPGTILEANREFVRVACGSDSLTLEQLIPEGKREMAGTEFLLGTPLNVGNNLSANETDNCQLRESADPNRTG